MNLADRFRMDVWSDPVRIGRQSTTIRYTQWYDMLNYKSIDFIVSGMFEGSTMGETAAQLVDFQIYKATDSSGGGSTAISSATGRMTKAGTNITTAAKAKSLMVTFATKLNHLNLGATFSVLGKTFLSADVGASVGSAFCGLTTVAASVAAVSFAGVFNTHASLASAWTAEVSSGSTARSVVYIRPRTATSVGDTVYVTASGSTLVSVGVPEMGGHLGISAALLRDGYRYVALGIAQGASGMTTGLPHTPVHVTVLREHAGGGPVTSTVGNVQFSRNYRATNAAS